MAQDGDGIFGECVECRKPGAGGAGEWDEKPGEGWK